jgi:ribose-phosphate pyrophosphokinase
MKIFAGNSNRLLAESVCEYLNLSIGRASVRRFADQEIFVEIQENVRGQDIFVIQSTSYPANDHLMELLIMIDAFRRSSARRITAVLPYFGYARQDRKPAPRTPISAKLVANLITHAGADRVLTLDLHAGQIQGFFDIPTDNLYAVPILAARRQGKLRPEERHGRLARRRRRGARPRARQAARLSMLAIVDKRRDRPGESEVMNVIGEVAGKRLPADRRHRRFRRHALQRRRGAA